MVARLVRIDTTSDVNSVGLKSFGSGLVGIKIVSPGSTNIPNQLRLFNVTISPFMRLK